MVDRLVCIVKVIHGKYRIMRFIACDLYKTHFYKTNVFETLFVII
jgi:hypothetical protein